MDTRNFCFHWEFLQTRLQEYEISVVSIGQKDLRVILRKNSVLGLQDEHAFARCQLLDSQHKSGLTDRGEPNY